MRTLETRACVCIRGRARRRPVLAASVLIVISYPIPRYDWFSLPSLVIASTQAASPASAQPLSHPWFPQYNASTHTQPRRARMAGPARLMYTIYTHMPPHPPYPAPSSLLVASVAFALAFPAALPDAPGRSCPRLRLRSASDFPPHPLSVSASMIGTSPTVLV